MTCVYTDQVEQAVGDMGMSLQLRRLILEPTDRRLAERLVSVLLWYNTCTYVYTTGTRGV